VITYHSRLHTKPEDYQIHSHWETGVVITGGYRNIYPGKALELKTGGMWWHGPGEPHGYAVTEEKTTVLVAQFNPEVIYSYPALGPGPLRISLPFLRPELRPALQRRSAASRRNILQLAETLAAETFSNRPDRETAQRLYFWLLLNEAVRDFPLAGSAGGRRERGAEEILKVVQYINENLGKRITLTAASRLAGQCRTRFAQQFKEAMGLPFAQYLIKRRLEGVQQDLARTPLKLSAIARRWGFYDGSHLLRSYRQYYGRKLEGRKTAGL
jgi:AraC-like DNA-binding protein